jgi:hypothetical protein
MKQKIACVVWAPSSSRMDALSSELNGERLYLSFRYGPSYLAPLRYVVLFFWTLILLAARNPDVVLSQNPPTICPLICLFYGKVFRKKVVIDHHAVWSVKTFGNSPLRKPIRLLELVTCRSAFANTTPHPIWSQQFQEMGGRRVLTIFDYVPTENPSVDASKRERFLDQNSKYLLLAPHGGHELERMENEITAVQNLPSVVLLVTGPPSKLSKRLNKIKLPSNVRYLGFLPVSEYFEILDSTDIGLSISDEPFTISNCLLQFASRSIPAISSRQEAVVALFGDSLFYAVSSSSKDVEIAIKEMISEPSRMDEFRKTIALKQREFTAKHESAMKSLKELIGIS